MIPPKILYSAAIFVWCWLASVVAMLFAYHVSAIVFFIWFWSNSTSHRPPTSPAKDNPVYGEEGTRVDLREAQSEV